MALSVEAQGRPSVPDHVLFRFSAAGDSGTAFIARVDRDRLILTAFHVLVPRGLRRGRAFRSAALDSLSRRITLTSFDKPTIDLTPGPNVPVDRAVIAAVTDVGVLTLPPGGPRDALQLAAASARIGDTVWLHAQLRGSTRKTLFHPATVVVIDSGFVVYVFHENLQPSDSVRRTAVALVVADSLSSAEERAAPDRFVKDFHLNFTSGAPVLNNRGEVVAINTMAGDVSDLRDYPGCCAAWRPQQLIGVGIHADTVRALVREAQRRSARKRSNK